ncbi:hypothetical protein QJQ45_001988 [Haematococcus lacustris]|nr:hypothetical protein QJQ45_001988 [Haematococcus lacustris]
MVSALLVVALALIPSHVQGRELRQFSSPPSAVQSALLPGSATSPSAAVSSAPGPNLTSGLAGTLPQQQADQERRNSQRWNDNVKLELQHLAAATPAGTSLVAIQRHVAFTLATWDAVWGSTCTPSGQIRLYGAHEKVLERYFKLEEEAAMASQQRWGTRKQLVVFFGNAGIGNRGGWGAKAVLQACRKVVERPNSGKPTDRLPGKVVTVEEFRTSMNSPQPCEEELDRSKPTRPEGWKPQPGQVQHGLLRSAWSKQFKTPVQGLTWCPKLDQATPGDIGKWVDGDSNAALNLQRIGEAPWRPLELCRWNIEQGFLWQRC